jgi:hypothetical protein
MSQRIEHHLIVIHPQFLEQFEITDEDKYCEGTF